MGYKKQTCEICKGTGINEWSEYGEKITINCSRCRGTLISYGSCSSCGFYLNENGICQSGLCGKRDPDAPSSSGGTTTQPIKISNDGTIIRGSPSSAPAPVAKPASAPDTPSTNKSLLRFDGFYHKGNKFMSTFLCFYNNGSVHRWVLQGYNNEALSMSHFDEQKKCYSKGKYTLNSNEISFNQVDGDGDTNNFKGQILNNKAILKDMVWNENEEYNFIRFQ